MKPEHIRRCFHASHISAAVVWGFSFVPPILAQNRNEPKAWMLWILVPLWPVAYAFVCLLVWHILHNAAQRLAQVAAISFLFVHQISAVAFLLISLRAVLSNPGL
jgi:hypothetical protein